MEDTEATKSTLVLEALCKQEHLDGDWPETHANVYDSLFAVVKHEICDVSFEFERSGTNDDTTAEVTDLNQVCTLNLSANWGFAHINVLILRRVTAI